MGNNEINIRACMVNKFHIIYDKHAKALTPFLYKQRTRDAKKRN